MEEHATETDGPLPGKATSIWLDTTPETAYDALVDGGRFDAVVVGGGIVGVTAAYALQAAGRSVAVVDRDRILEGVTGHTTAKLTSQHGLVYDYLVRRFGASKARQYAAANQAAIDAVEATVDELDVDCGFARTPAYTYVTSADDRADVRDEVDATRRLGLPASYTETTSLPFEVAAAVRFDDQARFHPRKYLLALARTLPGDGGAVYERTTVVDVAAGEPCRVETDRGTLTADDVVIATHFPVVDDALYFTRLYPKRSYVLAVRLRGDAPEGLYYRHGTPYFSVRPAPVDDPSMVLVGGQNHRTGHGGSTADRYRTLEREARDRFDVASVAYRWSTQDYASVDRVPFVGRHAPGSDHVYVATGFGGWGMSNGVAAGRLLADAVIDRPNPWRDVFRPNRFPVGASAREFLRHNAASTRHLVRDRLRQLPSAVTGGLAPGEGRVVEVDGRPVGISRDERGDLHAVAATCTHMGCLVHWNDGEATWDCPCHGSRFAADGRVLDTPAVDDLAPVDLEVARPTDAEPPG